MGGTLSRLVLLASFFVGLVTVPGSSAQKLPAPAASPRDNLKSQIKLSLPMSFESNQGQVAKEADFVARGAGYTALLQAGRARICLSHRLEGSSESTFDRHRWKSRCARYWGCRGLNHRRRRCHRTGRGSRQ